MLTLVHFYGPDSGASKDESAVTLVIVGVVVGISIVIILSVILCIMIMIKKWRRQQSYKCHYNSKKSLSI